MLCAGTDIRIIQALLGHGKLETTARSMRVATGMIAGIESPLDLLSQPRKKSKKSRKAEGDVGHRALPHGGSRRPCRVLRRLR